jgi:hypothetical protein
VDKLTLTLNRRAAASLLLVLALSFVNLVGAFLALTALGGTGDWNTAQFVGLFGILETAMGIAYLFAPNIWRLPVAEANTPDQTKVRLAPATLFIPHWLAAAKVFGGALMIAYAAASEGVAAATALIPVVVVAMAIAFLAATLAVARLGVTRPDIDVFFITIRRPRHEPRDLPGLSITGIIMQMLSNFGILFFVAALSPDSFYGPEIRPSAEVTAVSLATAALLAGAAALAWLGRISRKAPRAQEREAEAELAASS